MDGLLDEVVKLRMENEALKVVLAETLAHNERMKVALVDAMSIFNGQKEARVTGERIEAWHAALIDYRP